MTTTAFASTPDGTYQLRPTFWQVIGIFFGACALLTMHAGSVVFGLILIGCCVALWRAQKVQLTDKALIYATLMRKRTIP